MTRRELMTFDECRETLRALDLEAKQLGKLVASKDESATPKSVIQSIARVFMGFDNLTFDRKRALLEEAVSEIRVEDAGVVSVTLMGGFIGKINGGNFGMLSRQHSEVRPYSNLVIQFPKPLTIPTVRRGRATRKQAA